MEQKFKTLEVPWILKFPLTPNRINLSGKPSIFSNDNWNSHFNRMLSGARIGEHSLLDINTQGSMILSY